MYTMYESDCPWFMYENSYKTLLGGCLVVFGACGLLLNGWLLATFVRSRLLTLPSHVLVLNAGSAALGRGLLGFPFAASSALAHRWLFGANCCQLFAFFNQFLGVVQMASLVVICLERYYQVKSYKRDQDLSIKFYTLLVTACWLAGGVLSVPPLTARGGYACDVTNTVCSLDWSLERARQLGFNVPYLLCGAVLSPVIIIYFIGRVSTMERRLYRSEKQKEQRDLTKSVHLLTMLSLLLWVPAGLLCGWQALPPVLLGYKQQPPLALVLLAPVASEAATCLPALCFLAAEPRIRTAMLGRVRRNYAIIKYRTWYPGNFERL